MENKKIREPRQERSITKKNKIIQAAYEIFSEVGYYSANTTDIAKRAGVSTGIVYGYFTDKRDILLYVIDIYIKKVAYPCMDYIKELKAPFDFEKIITDIIDLTVSTHKDNANLHNILHSLAVTDEAISREFLSLEDHITENTTKTLESLGVTTKNLIEKVHTSLNIIQSFSHECVYDRHDYINYDEMRNLTIQMLVNLFK